MKPPLLAEEQFAPVGQDHLHGAGFAGVRVSTPEHL